MPVKKTPLAHQSFQNSPTPRNCSSRQLHRLLNQKNEYGTPPYFSEDFRSPTLKKASPMINNVHYGPISPLNTNVSLPPHSSNSPTNSADRPASGSEKLSSQSSLWGISSSEMKPQVPTGNIGRAPHDHRSAEEIAAGPLFSVIPHLIDSSENRVFIRQFFEQMGGYWGDHSLDAQTRADIAANAERVLQYIDSRGGKESIPSNQTIDLPFGNTPWMANPSKEMLTRENSEMRLLLDFCEKGYPVFQETKNGYSPNSSLFKINEKNTLPTHATGRPAGDLRTTEQIVAENPILKTLPTSVDQERFYKKVGGNWNDPNLSTTQRADAAYNAASVLNSIDRENTKWSTRLNETINGEVESPLPPPFPQWGIAPHSEAARVEAFISKGYTALKQNATA